MFNKFKKLSRGFTLIELLVVVTIIGILSVLVVVNLQDSRAKARNAQRKSDLNSIASALETYYADYNGYPYGEGLWGTDGLHYSVRNVAHSVTSWETSCSDLTEPIVKAKCDEAGGGWLWELAAKGYVDRVPADPFNIKGNTFNPSGDEVIGNFNKPGVMYIYFNDEPDYSACSYDTTYGHGQIYKLFAALERPLADRDWVNDGGAYPPPGTTDTSTWEREIGEVVYPSGETIDLGDIKAGFMYEVYSVGGAQAFAGLGGTTIGFDDLRSPVCY